MLLSPHPTSLPLRLYGAVLIGVYLLFVIIAVLGETHVLPFSL